MAKKRRYIGSAIGYGILWLVSFLPFWFLYFISDQLYLILRYLIRYRRRVVRDNLRRAFPEKSEKERLRIEKKFYLHLGDLMVETVKLWHISKRNIEKRCILYNEDLFHQTLSEGRSVIVNSAHYGNWEFSFCLRLRESVPFHLIPIYKPLKDPYFNRLFYTIRSRFGAEPLAKQDVLRQMVAHSRAGELSMTGFISDQNPDRIDSAYWTTFLSQPTAFFTGTEKIAKKLDQPVYYIHMRRLQRGHYRLEFHPVAMHPREMEENEILERCIQLQEGFIRENPAYWLWSHRRWKALPPAKQ